MPRRTLVPCGWPGCSMLVPPNSGHCVEHRRKKDLMYNRTRRTDATERELERWYNSPVWKRLRLMHLREHPLCVECGEAARIVDHIKPRRDGGEPLDPLNLQSMCSACHNRKRQTEKRKTPTKPRT